MKSGVALRFLLAACVLFAASHARADGPDVTATFTHVDGRADFAFVNGAAAPATKTAGVLNWVVPPTTLTTAGLERNFRSFCAEPLVPVLPGRTYDFRFDPIEKPAIYGLADDDDGRAMAQRKAKFLRELYGRYYEETTKTPAEDADAAAAFQVAVWEILAETEIPDGPMPLNLFAGTFRANYPREDAAPAYVRRGQAYVLSLTGNDAPFLENPLFAGSEIVRLTGLPGANGAAQSQLAVRMASGVSDSGVGGATPAGDSLGMAGGPGGLSPTRGGGLGGGFPNLGGGGGVPGGGGGFGGGGGGGSTVTADPTLTPGVTTPGTGGDNGGSGPSTGVPDGGTSPFTPNPPGGTDPLTPTPNNPVPGPGGLALAAVAVAALYVRRRRAA